MNSLRTVILLVVIFIIGVSAIYWVYQTQVSKSDEELLPLPSPETTFNEVASPSPVVEVQVDDQYVPDVQPEAGFDTLYENYPELR